MRRAEMVATSEKAKRPWWSRLAVTVLVTISLAIAPVTVSAAGPGALEPLTDEQWAAHVHEVDAKVAEALAQGRATAVTHTVNGDGVHWVPERAAKHRRIAAELYSRGAWVPDEGEALFTGGLPGAGKTTALNQNPDVEPSRYQVPNADDAKEKLCEHGLVPRIDGLSPLEGSELIQQEASAITDLVTGLAVRSRKNVIWDTTMSSHGSVDRRVDRAVPGRTDRRQPPARRPAPPPGLREVPQRRPVRGPSRPGVLHPERRGPGLHQRQPPGLREPQDELRPLVPLRRTDIPATLVDHR
ncbi:MAG: zeta toxin family protein [Actinomycetota bacterium]|nr:zeta toxin family protein [Actinomycetota bacterium]